MSCVPCLRSCNNISRRLCYVTLDVTSSSLSLIRQAVVVISSPLSLMSARCRALYFHTCRSSSPCRRSCINISFQAVFVIPSPLSLMSARYRAFESCYCRSSSPCRRSCIDISRSLHYVTLACAMSHLHDIVVAVDDVSALPRVFNLVIAGTVRLAAEARLIIFCCSIAALQHRRALCHTTLLHLSATPPSSTSSPSSCR